MFYFHVYILLFGKMYQLVLNCPLVLFFGGGAIFIGELGFLKDKPATGAIWFPPSKYHNSNCTLPLAAKRVFDHCSGEYTCQLLRCNHGNQLHHLGFTI